jgi:hypothetical protein
LIAASAEDLRERPSVEEVSPFAAALLTVTTNVVVAVPAVVADGETEVTVGLPVTELPFVTSKLDEVTP